MTKFSSSLPKGDMNGLTALSNALIANPKGVHIIVGVIDVKTVTTDVDTGDQVATVRFRRVEAIETEDADTAVRLMQRGTERRTGATMLPIEVEDELKDLLAHLVDPVTGELIDDTDDEHGDDDEEHGDDDTPTDPDGEMEAEGVELPTVQDPFKTEPWDEGDEGDLKP